MTGFHIICFFIYMYVAMLMISIGISQWRSKKPTAFYSGEKPFREDELSDIPMWNKKHGIMWIVYGITVLLSYAAGVLIGSKSVWYVLCIAGGPILPIFAMIWYHHKLIRIHRR